MYVATWQDVVVGYYYLVVQSVPPDRVSEEANQHFGRVNSTPCVYLGMLGVHTDYQGKGIGKTLMVDAMRKILDVASLVGVYALTLEAVDEETAARYERWGFTRFIDGGLAMFLPLTTIRQALESA